MIEIPQNNPALSTRQWKSRMAAIPKEARLPEYQKTEQSGWSRRGVLGLLGGVGVGLALGVDNLRGATTWSRRGIEISYVSQEARQLIPDHVTLVFPGYNIFDAVSLGTDYAGATDRKGGLTIADFGAVAALSYDNYELNIDELNQTICEFVDEQGFKKVTAIGSSTGGKIATRAVDRLNDTGTKTNLYFDGAPYSNAQVIGSNGTFVKVLAFLRQIGAPINGPEVRYGIEMAQRLGSGLSWDEASGRAASKLDSENCSTDLIGDQSEVIANDNLDEICARIGKKTKAAYTIASRNSLVDEPEAAVIWKYQLGQNDMPLIKGKGTEHASPGKSQREYGRNMLNIYQHHFKLKSVYEVGGYGDDNVTMNDKGQLTHESSQNPSIFDIIKP